jgi:hypothetical protein
VIGEGKNIWPNVEIHERESSCLRSPGYSNSRTEAELYQVILDAALSDPNTPHGREGYYFGASDEHRLYDLAKAYSQTLYDFGKGKSLIPIPFTSEEAQKYFGVIISLL